MYSSNYIHLCLIIWWWQLLYLSVFLLFFSNILLITYTFILFTNRITCDPCLDCIIRTLRTCPNCFFLLLLFLSSFQMCMYVFKCSIRPRLVSNYEWKDRKGEQNTWVLLFAKSIWAKLTTLVFMLVSVI